jgi:hypothetical protein
MMRILQTRGASAISRVTSNEGFYVMADAAEPKQPYDKHDEDPAHREQRIRERAYSMWEADGRPEGRAEQYWNRAQELIEDENLSAFPPSASRGNRT